MTAGSLARRFATVARTRADAVALAHRHEEITYAELDHRSAALASNIVAVTPSDAMIGICLPPGTAAVTAVVAATRAGRAYVPLDPTYPAERLRHIAEDAALSAVVVDDSTRASAPPSPVLLTPTDGGEADDLPDVGPDTAAYVIYTSGSTGRPKGVVVSHDNALSLLSAAGQVFRFDENDVWTLFHSISFDFSVWEMWGALLTGARLVVVDAEERLSAPRLLDLLAREKVTVFNVVPSLFREIAEEQATTPRATCLRYVVFGGEPVHLPSVSRFRAACENPPVFVNMYGITETTVHVTAHVLTEEDERTPARSPIGRPLPHLEVELLDEDLRPVPLGEVGEMWVSGAGVARGYLGRPELTGERFVWLGDGAERKRFYRSGDLASRDGDGRLDYHGRMDDQVKIRGFRIELGEVEATLESLPLVAEASAAVVPNLVGDPVIVAHVVPSTTVPRERTRELARRLRAQTARLLPRHAVPGRIVLVTSLPRTPSGKVDRAALRLRGFSA